MKSLIKKEKHELEVRCNQLVDEIKKIDEDYILVLYNKIKELYLLKKQIHNNGYDAAQLSLELGYGQYWIKQLFMLDECNPETWRLIKLHKIEPRIVLKVLNFNPKTVKDQTKIFEDIMNMNQLEVYRYLKEKYPTGKIDSAENYDYGLLLHKNLKKAKELLLLTNPKILNKDHWAIIKQEIVEIAKIINSSNLINIEVKNGIENNAVERKGIEIIEPEPVPIIKPKEEVKKNDNLFCPKCQSILMPDMSAKRSKRGLKCSCGYRKKFRAVEIREVIKQHPVRIYANK